MDSFTNLCRTLAPYENHWASLAAPVLASGLSRANGAVQFVGIEPAKAISHHKSAPVVVAVGINYDQGPNPNAHLRWLRDVKGMPDGVTDCYWKPGVGSPMRDALDHALAAWRRTSPAWTRPLLGNSHAAGTPPPWNDYILVATNLSPFITDLQWTGLKSREQRVLRSAWPRTDHLDALASLLAGRVDLWVGHGAAHVWPGFLTWSAASGIANWQLCYNLSAQGLANMRRAGSWARHPRHTLFA